MVYVQISNPKGHSTGGLYDDDDPFYSSKNIKFSAPRSAMPLRESYRYTEYEEQPQENIVEQIEPDMILLPQDDFIQQTSSKNGNLSTSFEEDKPKKARKVDMNTFAVFFIFIALIVIAGLYSRTVLTYIEHHFGANPSWKHYLGIAIVGTLLLFGIEWMYDIHLITFESRC